VAYWLRDIAVGFDKRGFGSLIPAKFIVCVAIGVAVALFANKELWVKFEDAIAFYAGGIAVNAILLAVCWAGFGRIFEIIGDPEFGRWLRHHQLDGYYGFYIDFIQLTQMAAVVGMGCGLISAIVSGLPIQAERAILGISITMSIYAAWWASDCVRLMQELGDNRITFAESLKNVRQMPQRPVAGTNES
jgi:hypothetical protein